MLADTALLLKLYWKIDRRADFGTQRKSRIAFLLIGVFLVFFSAVVGFYAAGLVDGSSIIQVRAEILPGLLLSIVMFGVVMVGFTQSLQALYLSDDLDKLLVAPLHTQAVMTAKLLSRLPSTVLVLLAATIPALVAFGVGIGMGPLFYLFGILLIVLTPLFGISLGAIVAILLVRLLPARRLNEWVGAASIVLGLVLGLLVYLPTMLGGDSNELDASTLQSMEAFVNHLGDLPLPTFWAGTALIEFGRNQFVASAFGSLGVYLLLTLGLFLGTIILANRLYLGGWLRMQSAGANAEDIGERPGLFGRNSLDFQLAAKDWLLRVRDPRLLAGLFSSVILGAFFLFSALRPADDGSTLFSPTEVMEEGSVDPLSAGVIVCGMLLFLGWLAFSNLSLTSLSIERSAFYTLKTAPVSASRLMRGKVNGVFFPYLLLITIGMVVGLVLVGFSLVWMPYGWLVLAILGYGLFSYLVSVGFLYPNLTWDDPRRMQNRKAALPSLLGALIISLIGILVAELIYILALSNPGAAILIVVVGLALLGSATWFFVHWCTKRVERAWPTIGTE